METILYIFSFIFLVFFAYVVGHGAGQRSRDKLWSFKREQYRKKVERLEFKIAELADGLVGKCEKCKGVGVTGDSGEYDCWACGGTGMDTAERLKNTLNKNLEFIEEQAHYILDLAKKGKKKYALKSKEIKEL